MCYKLPWGCFDMYAQPDLVNYVQEFERHASVSLGLGSVQIFMLYDLEGQTCQMEFNHFRNYIGLTFDHKMTRAQRRNFDMIARRLMPIDVKSPLGKQLVDESFA